MLSLFVSVDNSLTQKEIDPSMQEERKLLDAITAILHEEFNWMNEWINQSCILRKTLQSKIHQTDSKF